MIVVRSCTERMPANRRAIPDAQAIKTWTSGILPATTTGTSPDSAVSRTPEAAEPSRTCVTAEQDTDRGPSMAINRDGTSEHQHQHKRHPSGASPANHTDEMSQQRHHVGVSGQEAADQAPTKELLDALGTTISPELLVQALTHRSFSHEHLAPPTMSGWSSSAMQCWNWSPQRPCSRRIPT